MLAHERLLALGRRARPQVPDGPYVVVGLGQAGSSAVEALARVKGGDRVLAFDQLPAAVPKRVRRHLKELGARIHLGPSDGLLDLAPAPRTLIKSPGLPNDHPLLEEARRLGVAVIDELELGWRLRAAPMVAVTGTNGKTTTATLAAAVLSSSGLDARLAGNADTAPPLSALSEDPDVIVCEASSFQLEASPALIPEAAIFTNLSHDHLPRHSTMRRYAEVKRSLFIKGGEAVPLAVVDTIDEFGRHLADEVEMLGGSVVRVGVDRGSDYRIREAQWDLRAAELVLDTPDGVLAMETMLPGDFNARNVALVVALADSLGVERTELRKVLATHPGPKGRFEHIDCGQPAEVILDTASSPAAAEQFLSAVRSGMEPGGTLRAVLGVLGAPDPPQRREMGALARSNCDRLFLTSGSFRRNPPLRTLEGLIAGAGTVGGAEMTIIPNREEAIAAALDGAGEADVVAVLGRGNVLEAVHDEKLDDRGVLHRHACRHRLSGLGPEGSDIAAVRQLGVQLEQGGVGR